MFEHSRRADSLDSRNWPVDPLYRLGRHTRTLSSPSPGLDRRDTRAAKVPARWFNGTVGL
jgi:hypothetical protein